MTANPLFDVTDTPLTPELAPPAGKGRRPMGGSSPARVPTTVDQALEDVHRRYCGHTDQHDPVCALLAGEIAAYRRHVVGMLTRNMPSRRTDPGTSHAAEPRGARRVTATNQRGRLLAAFHHVGPAGCTDEAAATLAGIPLTSEYAKRCSELRDAGYVETTGDTRPGAAGVDRIVSRVTHAGAVALASAGIPDLT